MKWAWVIGGGVFQRPLVKEFIDQGYEVRVTDRNPDCACSDIAKIYVHDTYDFESQFELAMRLKKDNDSPSAVATAGTDVAHIVAGLASWFGLPACNPEAARRTRNKLSMRLAVRTRYPKFSWTKVRQTKSDRITDPEYLMPKKPPIPKYPVVIKPTDSSASRGLYVAHNDADLYAFCERAGEASHGSPFVIIEEFLGGALYAPQASTDWFILDGKPYFLNGVLRLFHDSIPGLETGYYSPWRAPRQVMRLARRAVRRLGVDQGPFKMDLIYDATRGGWCLLECTCRWSGGLDHNHAARLAFGLNFSKLLVWYSTGKQITHNILRSWSAPARNNTYYDGSPVHRVTQYVPVLPGGHIVGPEMLGFFRCHPRIIDVVALQRATPEIPHQTNRPVLIFSRGWQSGMRAAKEVVRDWEAAMKTRHGGSI